MRHFTKQIHNILYSMHDLLWVVIGLLLLLSLILIASSDSWLYLFLFVPFLTYFCQSKGIRFMKNKNSQVGRQTKHFTNQIPAIFHRMHDLTWNVIGGFIKNKNSEVGHQLKRFTKQIHSKLLNMHDLNWVAVCGFIKNKNSEVGHQIKRFTRQIHTMLLNMHDLIWVIIGLFLLLGVILIASSDSWLYLFLFVTFLVYLYQSKGIRFMKNKNPKVGKKS
jgi:hypothetical protein